MPTRTAFIITIGDVIESGPPRASRSSTNKANNSESDGEDSVASDRPQSPASSINSDDKQESPRPRRFRKRNRMKTRVSNSGGSSAEAVATASSASTVNGSSTSNGRRSRLQSVDQVYLGNSNNNPLSPRTRSSVKQEIDDEVSFVDPLSLEDSKSGCNGLENGHLEDSVDPLDTSTTALTLKKKRKSSAEKFLEEQSEYYGFQVLPSKLRSSSVESNLSHSTFLENSFTTATTTTTDVNDAGTNVQAEADDDHGDILGAGEHETDEKPPRRHRTTSSSQSDFETRDRSRHSSGASTTKRRIRANSSSSNHHSECINATKKLRVEVTKVDLIKQENSEIEASSSDETATDNDRSQRKKLRSRSRQRSSAENTDKAASNTNSLSPVSKKRRSELDKLLEAGLSSFHCETAKQAADRLGPLKVDVSDGSEAGSYEASEATIKSPGKSRLLQEADVNQNSKSPRRASKSPKKAGRGRPPGRGRKKASEEEEAAEDSAISPVSSSAFSPCVPNDMDDALKRVNSLVVEVDSLDFSFERTPMRESWFQTYTRQDQGDEILYYPENQSFPLPYEMPMNTFYPRKDIKKQPGFKSGRNTPSGTATPDEDEAVETAATPKRTSRRGGQDPQPSTSKKSTKKNPPVSTSEELSFFEKIAPKKAAALKAASEFSRKSPRGHASTKSLNAASPYVDDVDDDQFEELIDGAKKPVKKYVLAYKAMMASEGLDPEASNDSLASTYSTRKDESLEKLGEIAGQLETFFSNSLEDTSLLPASTTSSELNKKRSRRQSSSDKAAGSSATKKAKKSKNSEGDKLDKLLDSNVDPVFLDCLEDELPSVVFDEHHPKLDTMDLINDFDQCTSINLFKKKQKRKDQSVVESVAASDSEAVSTPVSSKDPSSTILRRLLTHSTEKKNNPKAPVKNAKNIPIPHDDSSSECNSAFETASVASSTSKRKRKRNMTGFPSPKKKKKAPAPAPPPPPPAPASTKPVKVRKIIVPKKSTLRKAAEKAARKAKAAAVKNGNKSSVQLKLNFDKNGLGLKKPSKSPTKVPSAAPAPKKAKPSPKSPAAPPAKKTSNKRTSRSSVPPPPPPKPEVIDIESSDDDEEDNDDLEDRTFRLKMKNTKVTKKRKMTKKIPLNIKSKKPVIPKLINIANEEEDDEKEDKNDEVDVEDSDEDSVASSAEEDTSDEDNDDSDEESEDEEDSEEVSDDEEDASDEEDRPIKPKLKKAGPKGRRLRARNSKA